MITYLMKNCVVREEKDRDFGSFIIKVRPEDKKKKNTNNRTGVGFGTLAVIKRKTPKSRITGSGKVILRGVGTMYVNKRPPRK